MDNWGYAMLGEMLIGLGNALKDENSDLRKRFKLSREQLMTLLGVVRLASSPDIQKKFIWDLSERWNVTPRTIRNWVDMGLLREGHKSKHDTRLWWDASELDEDERNLIKYGYIKPRKHHRLTYFINMLNSFKG